MIKIKEQKISSLRGSQRVRQRPSVIFGDNGHSGVSQAVFEMVSNSLDECRRGYGNKVTLIKHKDLSYSVIDEGRGIPLDWNESEKDYNFQLIFQRLYAGGNYDNKNTGDITIGTNGLGSTSTCYASEFFNVESYKNNNEKLTVKFIEGRVVDKNTNEFLLDDDEMSLDKDIGKKALLKEKHKQHTGTKLHFKPDKKVFTEINVDLEWLKQKLKMQAVFNLKTEIILIDEFSKNNKTYRFYFESIEEYLNTLVKKEDNLTNFYSIKDSKIGKDTKDSCEYECKFELGFLFNNNYNSDNRIVSIHNSSEMINDDKRNVIFFAIRYGFLRSIEKLIKDNNGYNSKDKGKINYHDIEDSLILLINSSSNIVSFSDQTKLGINNPFIKTMVSESIKNHLDIYFTENKMQSKIIMNQVLVNFRARTKADETKKKIKKQFENNYSIFNRPKNFVNCTSRDVNNRELIITEGRSALGACKLARDSQFQALMPIRGKILNCLKADYNKIFKSDIIVELIKLLGCGVEMPNKKYSNIIPMFDIKKLQWDKIIIASDQDSDGFNIRCLVIMMIYRLIPTLIRERKIYYIETPLFEIDDGKKVYFAYSDKEKEKILKKIKSKHIRIQRSKGLGQNTPEMMSLTAMNPDTRKLVQVTMDDIKENYDSFMNAWMGDDIIARKPLVENAIEEFYMEEI